MGPAKITQAAERLGVEKDLCMKRLLKRTGFGAIVAAFLILLLYLFLMAPL